MVSLDKGRTNGAAIAGGRARAGALSSIAFAGERTTDRPNEQTLDAEKENLPALDEMKRRNRGTRGRREGERERGREGGRQTGRATDRPMYTGVAALEIVPRLVEAIFSRMDFYCRRA